MILFGERHTARTLRQDGALSADADRVFGDDRVSSERVGGDETDVQTRLDHAVSTLLHRTRALVFTITSQNLEHDQTKNAKELLPEKDCYSEVDNTGQLGISILQQGSHRPQTPPQCCHLRSYFKRPKSSPVLPLACNWYYCVQLIAKPKAACALHFSWAATSSNLGL